MPLVLAVDLARGWMVCRAALLAALATHLPDGAAVSHTSRPSS